MFWHNMASQPADHVLTQHGISASRPCSDTTWQHDTLSQPPDHVLTQHGNTTHCLSRQTMFWHNMATQHTISAGRPCSDTTWHLSRQTMFWHSMASQPADHVLTQHGNTTHCLSRQTMFWHNMATRHTVSAGRPCSDTTWQHNTLSQPPDHVLTQHGNMTNNVACLSPVTLPKCVDEVYSNLMVIRPARWLITQVSLWVSGMYSGTCTLQYICTCTHRQSRTASCVWC